MQVLLNQPLTLSFTSSGLTLGKTSFLPILLSGGSPQTPTFTYVEIGYGVYTVTFTPTTTGNFSLFIEGSIQARFQVVARLELQFLQDLTDECLGSWTWNKTTGALALFRQDGSSLANFNVSDNMDAASRERV